MKILFIQTGGTIDKDYTTKVKSYAFEIGEPAIKRVIENIDLNFKYSIKTVLKKDSMDLTAADRALIKETCLNAKENKIIITHGTDTMVETANVLGDIKGKTIILTGALIPERIKNSDAAFNIGTAVGAINILNEGVFVAMNGIIYHYNNVIKDSQTGQFIEKIKNN